MLGAHVLLETNRRETLDRLVHDQRQTPRRPIAMEQQTIRFEATAGAL